jgi:proteasome lid subunit RPN8/RPN11
MTVIIPKKAYLTVVAASIRFANQTISFQDWLEVYGIFTGKISENKKDLLISAAYTISHQIKREEDVIDKFEYTEEDNLTCALIDDEVALKGDYRVGWWHSHPGHKVMMTSGDLRTTQFYQQFNPLAISLVFNPLRLTKQIQKADRIGDPEIKLKNDPGFKIFRLDDSSSAYSTYHEVNDYRIEGFESLEQLVEETQKFALDIAKLFPKDEIIKTYKKFIKDKAKKLNSLLMGTEEYLKTLTIKGEKSRIPEVLEAQKKDINRFVAETFMEIGNIKDFTDYLEYRERDDVIPKVDDILSKWDESISKLDDKLNDLSKRF